MIDSNPIACTCPSGDGSLRHPCQVHNANYVGDAAPFDLVAHLERQRYFSAHTFGPEPARRASSITSARSCSRSKPTRATCANGWM